MQWKCNAFGIQESNKHFMRLFQKHIAVCDLLLSQMISSDVIQCNKSLKPFRTILQKTPKDPLKQQQSSIISY